MKVSLKDGSVREYAPGITIFEVAKDISEGLARNAAVGKIDGEKADLRTPLTKDCELEILTIKDPEGLATLRHTTSHVMAEAVLKLFPDAKVTIGPSIADGFYYDFDHAPFSNEDLRAIEKEMKAIIKKGSDITRYTLPRAEAIQKMKDADEPYKVELIEDLPEDAEISFYAQEGFTDLCAGPHLMNLKQIKHFKLISSSGAYWRGDEHRQMLQRIYGTVFPTKDELQAYLDHLEEIKQRDHNKIGREMGIFTTVDVIGQGLPLLMPKGAAIIQTMQRWIEDEETHRGYMRTKTPFMAKRDLYIISDHWAHYKDGMFLLGDEEKNDAAGQDTYALRPMTCPFQYYVFKQSQHSYRDMPCRYGETSTLFRNEQAGEMHGLTRVRQFTISEGHLIIRPDQAEEEFKGCVELMRYCLSTLGLEEDVTYRLSLWDPKNPDKYMGTAEEWDEVQNAMRRMLDHLGIDYYEKEGEAAFYGPKLDVQAKNVYGKEDTMITIQLDRFIAERFDMYFIDENGEKRRPYVIHRTSIGCYERTLAWLIEKYKGQFPTWLCPEQVRVLAISDKYNDYAQKVTDHLIAAGIKAKPDKRSEKIGYKIRQARMDRLPYMLIVGEKEEADGTVSVRSRFAGDEGAKALEEFEAAVLEEIRTKEIRKPLEEKK